MPRISEENLNALLAARDERDKLLEDVAKLAGALTATVAHNASITDAYEKLLSVVTGSLTACAESNLAIKLAVKSMQGVVADLARPRIVLYEGGSSQTC